MGRYNKMTRQGYKEIPGTAAKILLIHFKDILNRPKTVFELGQSVSTYAFASGDKVKIGEEFNYRVVTPAQGQTPAVLAKWVSFDINVDSGAIDYETIGDRGFEAWKNGVKGTIIGALGDPQREFLDQLNEDNRCLALMQMRYNENYALFGSQMVPLSLSFKGESGYKAGDANKIDVEINDNSGMLWKTYPKNLALSVDE